MPTNTYINVKDLPEIKDVLNGDFLLVETNNGTNIINFENFIIPEENTVISIIARDNETAILNLSAETAIQFADVNTSISNLNASIVAKAQLIIPPGANQISGPLIVEPASTLPQTLLSTRDIIIVPASPYAASNPCYVQGVDQFGIVTIAGPFLTYSLNVSTTTSISISSNTTSNVATVSSNVPANVSVLKETFASTGSNMIGLLNQEALDTIRIESTNGVVPEGNSAIYNVFAIKRL